MHQLTFLLTLLLYGAIVNGQTLDITGTVKDSTGQSLLAASVMLLEPDSSLVEFTDTDLYGEFNFKKVPEGAYLIKITYLGYLPYTVALSKRSGKEDIGTILMAEIDTRIMDVVIREAKAPMRIVGDTLEYDATTFKVPEGSTLEDLLKRLPGVMVDQDGNIRAEGQAVTRVTVEGKTFFSDDPQMATKNLPAEGISKVQVFDRKTEEEKLMGEKASSNEKEMNVVLKEDFKKGGFGKITAGAGNIDRRELKGNYNRYDDKQQLSLIAVGNNTGRNGLGWNDRQDFLGSSAYGFSTFGLDYGFGSSGNTQTFIYGGAQGNELESQISSAFFDYSRGGFPSALIGGVNYNYERKKTKLSVRYMGNNKGNIRTTDASSFNFLPNFTTLNQSIANFDDNTTAHKIEAMLEQKIDSLTTLSFVGGYSAVDKQNIRDRNTLIIRNSDIPISSTENFNNELMNGYLITGIAILRRQFKKKGRFLGANSSVSLTDVINTNTNNADFVFFAEEPSGQDSLSFLRQNVDSDANKNQWSANIMFNEPLGKKFFLNTFYNFRTWTQDGLFIAVDQENGANLINPNLSRDYENSVTTQRGGSTLKYNHEGFNVAVGAGYQTMELMGVFSGVADNQLSGFVNQRYNAPIYYAEIRNQFGRRTDLNLTFNRSVSEPSLENLLPLVNNLNPLYITEGNPELLPQVSNRFSLNFSTSKPVTGTNFYLYGSYDRYINQIIQAQTVDANLITFSRPVNYDGGDRGYTGYNFSTPIKTGKLQLRYNGSLSLSNTFAIINEVLNETTIVGYNQSLRFDLTLSDRLSIYTGGGYSQSFTSYDISTSQNQTINRLNYDIDVNAKLFTGLVLSGKFTHSYFRNERFGQNFDLPILNISLSKQVLKQNRGEVRLSLYDAFDRTREINQFASLNQVSESVTTTLARYAMLSFTYNIRGAKKGGNSQNIIIN
jgi:hypothetical protein